MSKEIIINEGIHQALSHTYHTKWAFLIAHVNYPDKYYYRQVDQDGSPVIDPDDGEPLGWCGPYKTIEIAYREAFSLAPDWPTYLFVAR